MATVVDVDVVGGGGAGISKVNAELTGSNDDEDPAGGVTVTASVTGVPWGGSSGPSPLIV